MAAFLKLVEEGQVGRVTRELTRVIEASFQARPMPSGKITQAEVKRRFEILSRIFEALRSDMKWGIERILDKLPEYLGCELDGADWKPDARTIWTPADGA